MPRSQLVSAAEIRTRFSAAMSHMYRREVPLYGDLLALVAQVNARVRAQAGTDAAAAAEDTRLQVERHGAVRVGKPEELRLLRRLFDVMGMKPVGYYDLSGAGVPVHSTAFRPVTPGELAQNPFRVFTSLLRLELIADPALRDTAAAILATRDIFTPRLRELTAVAEQNGGLDSDEADEFVEQAMETFRWHAESVVPHDTYARLHDAHRLIADVVSFKGPHINHLTPRTLDIDQVQALMAAHGMSPKASIEGPPPRRVPILLRQTSFKALHEPIAFKGGSGGTSGTHTARFGEVEQRGIALSPKGRALYDTLLAAARDTAVPTQNQSPGLGPVFEAFPDTLDEIRQQGLGYFHYALNDAGAIGAPPGFDLEALIRQGRVTASPITYEDFLPVSAAGIFQSNLGDGDRATYESGGARSTFEAALGAAVIGEFGLYEAQQAESLERIRAVLRAAA